jgi:hypothetical protein
MTVKRARHRSRARTSEESRVLDERSLAIEARDVVVRMLGEPEHHDQLLHTILEAVESENPAVPPERVKAAIIALLNRGILELTPKGHLRLTGR